MRVRNIDMTTGPVQLVAERCKNPDFTADRDNAGIIKLTIHNDPGRIVEKLAAGESLELNLIGNLQEIDAESSIPNDVLIVRF